MIKFEGVSIKYIKDYYSLYNINLEIDKNTILLGNETSGNNFVLRLISKIDKNYEGKIFIDEKNLKDIKDKDLNIAYVPKEIYLFKKKSVFYNLFYPFKVRKINKQIATDKILTKLKKFDVRHYISVNLNDTQKDKLKEFDDLHFYKKVKIKNLNFTAQKLIMLLRAIVREPKYILCENIFDRCPNTNITNLTNNNYYEQTIKLFTDIINQTNSIFILSENANPYLNDFGILYFDAGSIKK